VGFLGVLDFRFINPRRVRQELIAVFRADQFAGGIDGDLRQIRRIRTHVSDVAVFVQALSDVHRPPGGEAELAVGFLLQGAGSEGLGRLLV